MTLRESINNAIRSDRPESPTDMAFIFLVIILGFLWIYATVTGKEISSVIAMIAFIGTIKGIKIGSDFQKKRKAAENGSQADQTAPQ